MLVAAAVCPCPPLLVPEVAVGAAPELASLRTACSDAMAVLTAARPDRLVVLGPAEQAGHGLYREGSTGSFRPFGVHLDVVLGQPRDVAEEGSVGRSLPASLAVGAWLLARTEWSAAPVEGFGVAEPLAVGRCTGAGRELAASAERVALLVMGDGSARRSEKAPGYLDERAEPFDASVAAALAAADTAALAALDEQLAAELQAAGRAPWQVLAGAAGGAGLSGTLLYSDAPYGVGYFVATWS
ncbi:MAG: class III extradiol dioxygenase subunit B-like domain-containing protein [Streptomycetaceae bacterium]|nr:class III extradiol dioxygenase subunit B-like domain-containing protein [Streptomycetaceae bacterium]